MDAYLHYRECAEDKCFEQLSPDEKTAVFFGAMEIHPPDVVIDQVLAKENLDYLKSLKAEIEKRGGSYEAYSFVSAVRLKLLRGEVTEEQVEELELATFCREGGDLNNLCTSLMP